MRQSFRTSSFLRVLTLLCSIEREDLQRAEVLEKYTAFEEVRAQSIVKAASATTFDPTLINFSVPLPPKMGMTLEEVLAFGKTLIGAEEEVVAAKGKGRKSATKGKGKARASTSIVDDLEISLAAVRLQVRRRCPKYVQKLSFVITDGEFRTAHPSNNGIHDANLVLHLEPTARIARPPHAFRRRRTEYDSRFGSVRTEQTWEGTAGGGRASRHWSIGRGDERERDRERRTGSERFNPGDRFRRREEKVGRKTRSVSLISRRGRRGRRRWIPCFDSLF